jgi:ankyrin repeat protein
LLLRCGAAVDGALDRLPYCGAAQPSIETLTLLLEHGAHVQDESILIPFAATGNTLAVALLLKYSKVSPSIQSVNALTMAASKGHRDVIKLLLENGVDVNGVDEQGCTALLSACQVEAPPLSAIQMLLEKAADANAQGITFSREREGRNLKNSPCTALTNPGLLVHLLTLFSQCML